MDCYETSRLTRFDIAFKHEARYGETARVSTKDGLTSSISVGDRLCALARMEMVSRI